MGVHSSLELLIMYGGGYIIELAICMKTKKKNKGMRTNGVLDNILMYSIQCDNKHLNHIDKI